MQILLIGPGSIGCLFGGKLALIGNEILVYGHQEFMSSLKNNYLNLTDIHNTQHSIKNFKLAPKIQEFLEKDAIIPDICLIATKSYDLEYVCDEYKPVLSKIPIIGLIQNGIGNEEILKKNFPDSTLFRIITSNGALRKNSTHIIHTGTGLTSICQIAPLNNGVQIEHKQILSEFIENLREAGFEIEISRNPLETIWRKAITNIGINAIGALTKLSNGELLKSDNLSNLIQSSIKEAIKIAQHLAIPLESNFDYKQNVFNVLKNTAANKNSMLQDILRKKQTEIDFLNGKIAKYGAEFNISTPTNNVLTYLVKGLEKAHSLEE